MFTRGARTRGVTPVSLAATTLLAATSLLAAGCAGPSSAPPAGGPAGPAATASAPRPAPPAPPPVTSPLPTAPVSGPGPVIPATTECTGWPANMPVETVSASFVPVKVLRCVTADAAIPGKGQWLTAELQRADKNLAGLAAALRRPSGHAVPGQMCPQIVVPTPAFVLVDAAGTIIRPRLPVNDCGMIQSQVLATLASLPWQTVSVRLLSPVKSGLPAAAGYRRGACGPAACPGHGPPGTS